MVLCNKISRVESRSILNRLQPWRKFGVMQARVETSEKKRLMQSQRSNIYDIIVAVIVLVVIKIINMAVFFYIDVILLSA